VSAALPTPCRWTGENFEPLPRFAKLCDQRFVIGEVYLLEEVRDRSLATHRHFFAAMHHAWLNLREDVAERFPTETHLRKWSLIKCGYHDQRSIVAASKAEALRIAAFIKPMDEFAIVVVSECTVTVYTAKSQSKKAMGGADFQRSKQDVLDYVAALIGTETERLKENVG
jgi:hypothetical protein